MFKCIFIILLDIYTCENHTFNDEYEDSGRDVRERFNNDSIYGVQIEDLATFRNRFAADSLRLDFPRTGSQEVSVLTSFSSQFIGLLPAW